MAKRLQLTVTMTVTEPAFQNVEKGARGGMIDGDNVAEDVIRADMAARTIVAAANAIAVAIATQAQAGRIPRAGANVTLDPPFAAGLTVHFVNPDWETIQ